jgi:NAD(P)-dependent dehydrogenase (short-subunit alcohol dehydrogenase family)
VETALVVGSSDGIGLALCRQLLERGFAVSGIARSPAPLAHERYRHAQLDVTDPHFSERLRASLPAERIALCIYCAGIGERFSPEGLRLDVATLDTNLLGLARTLECLLPRLTASPPAVFAGLSSLADVVPSRIAPAYAASKAGMTYYLEGLATPLRRSGVAIVNVRLGFVDTKMAKSPWKPCMLTPDVAATRILRALLRERPAVRVNIPRRMAFLLRALAPALRPLLR